MYQFLDVTIPGYGQSVLIGNIWSGDGCYEILLTRWSDPVRPLHGMGATDNG